MIHQRTNRLYYFYKNIALWAALTTRVVSFIPSSPGSGTSFPWGSTTTKTTTSFSSSSSSSSFSSSSEEEEQQEHRFKSIQYLGKGKDCIIQPGTVLISPKSEMSHFLSKAAIFIYAMGLNDYGDAVVRGVIIDHPTVFTMQEMAPAAFLSDHELGNNLLFRGGDSGNDSAILLHTCSEALTSSTPIGDCGIYEGGLRDVGEGTRVDPTQCKFFFNYIEFRKDELNAILLEGEEDGEGDLWMTVQVPNSLILDSDLDRAEAWKGIRTVLRDFI